MSHPPSRSEVRLETGRTLPLYIGGAFPRATSGRTYRVHDVTGRVLGDAAAASDPDARDAVQAARRAFGGWSARPPYQRGQVVYRVAETLEDRRGRLAEEVQRTEGVSRREAEATVDASVDRLVWYAGWADKIAHLVGGAHGVAGPYVSFSVPRPVGVVAVLAPQRSSLLGLVSVVAPVVVTGNTAVVAAAETWPLPAVTLAEVLAVADVPPGVVNVLTGRRSELPPALAGHPDIDGLDLTGCAGDPAQVALLERAAAARLPRVLRAPAEEPDWTGEPGLARMTAFLHTRTVWHPAGD